MEIKSEGYRRKRPNKWIVIIFFFVMCFQQAICQANSEYPPLTFTSIPLCDSPVSENGGKIFVCSANGVPSPQYKWLKDGQIIPNKVGPQLRIDKLTRDDAGFYQCLAENNKGAILSKGCNFVIAYMEDLPKLGPQEIRVSAGKHALLKLPPIDSVPEVIVDWYDQRSSSMVSIYDSSHYLTLDKELVLLDTKTQNTGKIYYAEVTNGQVVHTVKTDNYTVFIEGSNPDIEQPKVIVPPKNQIVSTKSTSAAFDCVINASPIDSVTINWYKISGESRTLLKEDPAEGKYIFSVSPVYHRRLEIKAPLVFSDAATYECEGDFTVNSVTYPSVTGQANLTVHDAPRITSQINSDYSRDYAQKLDIDCSAVGVPAPQITWYYNGKLIQNNSGNGVRTLDNGTLHIERLALEHAGMYQCFADNVEGQDYKITQIKVNSFAPTWQQKPSNLTVVEGEDALFQCLVIGAPKPVILWYKFDGNIAQEIRDGTNININEDGSLLIGSTKAADAGTYFCNATNNLNSISSSAQLSIIIRTQIVSPPQNLSIVLGNTADMPCGISHDSGVSVTLNWYRLDDNKNKDLIVPDSRITIKADYTLEIMGVRATDMGMYMCAVTSSGGNDSRSAYLSVTEIPYPSQILAVQLHPTNFRAANVTWRPGDDGNSPILRFIMQYRLYTGIQQGANDGWVTSDSQIPAMSTWHVVENLKPAQQYQFRIQSANIVGISNSSAPKPDGGIKMPEQAPSGPPKNFYGSARSNSSIMLQWQSPDEDKLNGILLGYTIRFKITGYATYQSINVTTVPYLLTDLVVFKEYEIQIAAFNSEGIGVWSGVERIRTQEGVPEKPPKELSATVVNSTSIVVSWVPPRPPFINGINLGYKIYGKKPSEAAAKLLLAVPPDVTDPENRQTTVLADLEKFTLYTLKVTCYTSVGNGPFSNEVSAQTDEDIPGQVGSLTFTDVADTSIKVIWDIPSDTNGIITGYKVEWELQDKSDSRVNQELNPSLTSYTITPLSPITNYTIYVSAKTTKGYGPSRSADIRSGVPPDRPKPPYNLGVSNIGATSVRLQFLPGYDGQTSITLWIVQGLVGDSQTWEPVYNISDPKAQNIVVRNLRPYTKYRLRMIAVNVVGPSLNASLPTSQFQTLQAAPGKPPSDVTVRAQNEPDTIRISWTPLSSQEWHGIPKGYNIYYKSADDPTFEVLSVSAETNSLHIRNLQEYTQYEVKMQASNDVGNSVFSPVVKETTRESTPSAGPQNVQAVPLSSTAIRVTWSGVNKLDQNGLILGYKVKYGSQEANLDVQVRIVPGNTTYNITLQDLRKFVSYEVQVLAYTRMGDGTLSQPPVKVKTLSDVPGPPVRLWFPEVSGTSAKIEWSPPVEPNGYIEGYMVSYKLEGTSVSTNSSQLLSTQLSYTVATLMKEQYYEFSVTAKTGSTPGSLTSGWGTPAKALVLTMSNREKPRQLPKPSIYTSEIESRAIKIGWLEPGYDGYGPIRNFTIQYSQSGGSWVDNDQVVPPNLREFKVTGLRPNTNYKFRVAAFNDIGRSPMSPESDEAFTLSDKPDGRPINVTIKPLTTISIRITWEAPPKNTWNAPTLRYYKVFYKQEGLENHLEAKVDYPNHLLTLDNLVKDVNYEVTVIAVNAVGEGPPSYPAVVYVGEAAPAAPPNNVGVKPKSSSELQVEWEEPPTESLNGALSGYKILYWMSADEIITAKEIQTDNVKTWTIKDLSIFTNYSVKVRAFNIAGDGPFGATKFARTLESLPGKPGNISFSNITLTSLNVSWSPPNEPNGIIVGYELTYSLQNDDESLETSRKLKGTTLFIYIDRLQENKTYTFSVMARTSIDLGPKSTGQVRMGPQPESPGAPGKPSVSIHEDGTVDISWTPGRAGVSETRGYEVEYKTRYTPEWVEKHKSLSPETRTSFSIPSVCSESGCYFRVRAFNDIALSHPSSSSDLIIPIEVKRPFHYEWWFAVIMAMTGCIVILLIISCLCYISRNKQPDKKPTMPAISSSNLDSIEPEDGGFTATSMEMRQSRRSLGQRNGQARTATIYARSPPRPSPASVAYSDDDGATAKSPLPDDSSSDVSEKPSNLGDSTADEDSDVDSIDKPFPPPPPLPPASPPPPPFSNPYENDRGGPSWRKDNSNSNYHSNYNSNLNFNAYTYTDSEAESSHYGLSLNGGQIIMNNAAGSRAPLPGFSSFV